MQSLMMKSYLFPLFCLLLSGCATLPVIVPGSSNYLTIGSIDGTLKGNEFFMAIGNVNLYRRRALGGVAPTGRSAESPVALQADRATGLVQRIVTLQAVPEQTVTTSTTSNIVTTVVRNDRRYVLGPLIGGVSIIDIHPYPSWLEAISAVRRAAEELGESGNFRVPTQDSVTTKVLPPPFFGWFPPAPHPRGGRPRR